MEEASFAFFFSFSHFFLFPFLSEYPLCMRTKHFVHSGVIPMDHFHAYHRDAIHVYRAVHLDGVPRYGLIQIGFFI